MGCLEILVALFLPRATLFFIWILTSWTKQAFETHFWPFLGFIFMPFTTLVYLVAMVNNNNHVSGGIVVSCCNCSLS